ncbi:hypothetical protein ZWY2020_029519 [Hordeum vulgare]|nr:hypothetical protein ZWY2020_029519 [Hordeum vulgare]
MDGTDGNGICFPYDVLVDILRRLPCRPLVESRRVCRTWRTIVDALAPPPHDCFSVLHCCNGLLLLKDRSRDHRYVCNPATVRIAVLPPLPEKETRLSVEDMFLAFDPAVSRHHEVFLLPEGKILPEEKTQPQTWVEVNLEQLHLPMLFEEENLSEEDQDEIEITCHSDYARDSNTTQPSDVISVLVFSSQTNQWVNREFVPGHYAPKKLYDMVTAPHPSRVKTWKSAEYWQGSFYVHCWNNILLILRNSEGTYGMVELPGKACIDEHTSWSKLLESSVLASYERGVRYVAHDKIKLRVWTLMESEDGQVEWMLAHQAELSHEIEQWVDPRVPWKVVGNNKAIASLFEPYNVDEFMYEEEDSQSDTADDDLAAPVLQTVNGQMDIWKEQQSEAMAINSGDQHRLQDYQ